MKKEAILRDVPLKEYQKFVEPKVNMRVVSRYRQKNKWSTIQCDADIVGYDRVAQTFDLFFVDDETKQQNTPIDKINVSAWECAMNEEAEFNSCEKGDEEEVNTDHWAQCDSCRKWRKLESALIARVWYCRENPDENYNSCEKPQAPDHETMRTIRLDSNNSNSNSNSNSNLYTVYS